MIGFELVMDYQATKNSNAFYAKCMSKCIDWFQVRIEGEPPWSLPAYVVYEFSDGSAVTVDIDAGKVRFTDTVSHAMSVLTSENGLGF